LSIEKARAGWKKQIPLSNASARARPALTDATPTAQNPVSAADQTPGATAIGPRICRGPGPQTSARKNTRLRMNKSKPQNLKNHGKMDPPFHMVFFTVLVVNLVMAISFTIHHFNVFSAWLVIISIAVFIPWVKMRTYPLKVQDRVIRLEERIRLQSLAPAEWHTQIYRLTEDQLIGLRFAADDEVVELAKQALEANLSRKQIKERIKSWRADNWRI
jgi:hypothetical protein